jgi:hypothetical protein
MAVWARGSGIIFLEGGREFVFSAMCRLALRTPPPSLLFNKCSSFLSPRYNNLAVKLTALFQLMPRLRTSSAIPLLPLCLYGMHRHLYTMQIEQLSASNR